MAEQGEQSSVEQSAAVRPNSASGRWADLTSVAVLIAACVVVFAWRAATLGLHSDDAALLVGLGDEDFSGALSAMRGYLPGRPLHIVWAWMILQAAGNPTEYLGRMHLVQSLLDGAAVGLFYSLLRAVRIPWMWSFIAALVFAFYPNHGETHFWLTAAPQNIACVVFVLLNSIAVAMSIRAASARRCWRTAAWCAAGWTFFTLGVFTYEQGLVWMVVLGAVQSIILVRLGRTQSRVGYWILPAQAVSFAGLLWLKTGGFRSMHSGPTMQFVSREHLSARYGEAFRSSLYPFHDLYEPFNLATDWMRLATQPVMLAVVALLLIACVVWVRRSNGSAATARPEWHYVALLLLAVGLYFAGYLPACMWFISPRHNYLPTVAICAAGACAAAFIERLTARVIPAANRFLVRPALAAFGFVLAAGGIAVAGEESANWAASYQLRRAFYREMLAGADLGDAKAVVLEGFPLFHRGVPCFANESIHAVRFESRRRANVDWVSESSLDVEAGRYLNVRADRWGPEGIKFVPAGRSVKFVCTGVEGNPPTVTFRESRDASDVQRNYRVHLAPADGAPAAGKAIGVESASWADGDNLRLTGWIDRRQLPIPPDGSAALLLWSRDERTGAWTPHTRGDAVKLLSPIHLGRETDLAAVTTGDGLRFECVIGGVQPAKRYKIGVRAFDMAGMSGGGDVEFTPERPATRPSGQPGGVDG